MTRAVAAAMNRLVLAAQLVERGALRYTPAGLPALDFELKHESELSEDGQPRKVSMEIRAVAIGAHHAAAWRRWNWAAQAALPASWPQRATGAASCFMSRRSSLTTD